MQITDNERSGAEPCLYDGTLVWLAHDGNDCEIFYWDEKTIQRLTDNDIRDGDPSLWDTGLNTTIAYVETWWEGSLRSRIICLTPALTVSMGPGSEEITITWPSLDGKTYRVQYSEDLCTWHLAAEAVLSAGYGETSWTDCEGSGTALSPSSVSQRFYRVCEIE